MAVCFGPGWGRGKQRYPEPSRETRRNKRAKVCKQMRWGGREGIKEREREGERSRRGKKISKSIGSITTKNRLYARTLGL